MTRYNEKAIALGLSDKATFFEFNYTAFAFKNK